jgi:hypothetical protein
LLKLRNAANNAWITIGTLADANLGLLSLAGGTLTGALLADDSGTAALPAIAFDGDTNTGIFSPGADQLGIATNGVERVEFGTTEVVFNDGGADVDFRVEGDTNANLFKVDAGTDTVIIDGLTHPSADGSADQSLVTNGSGTLSFASRSRLVRGTSVASTSGTSIDFTGIPSWARRVMVLVDLVSTNGNSPYLLRLGTSGGVQSTGYSSGASVQGSTNIVVSGSSAVAFVVSPSPEAASVHSGILTLANITGNSWTLSLAIGATNAGFSICGGGSVSLSGVLDRVRITTSNGTDTFDAGTINILYEG